MPLGGGQQPCCSRLFRGVQQTLDLDASATLEDRIDDRLRLQTLVDSRAHVTPDATQLDERWQRRTRTAADSHLDPSRIDVGEPEQGQDRLAETCPFDAPRPANNEHWDFIGALSTSSLYLSKTHTYRGYSLLVFDARHVERLDELSADEWSAFAPDLSIAHNAISRVTRPVHMNIELLGNVIRHLHWHIVARYAGLVSRSCSWCRSSFNDPDVGPAPPDQLVQHHSRRGRDVQRSLLSQHRDADVCADLRGDAGADAFLLVAEYQADRPLRFPLVQIHRIG